MGFMAVPADGSCHMLSAGIAFHMTHTMGEFPSHRAALEFCSLTCCSVGQMAAGKRLNTKKLMLSIFSEIDFFNVYKAVLMYNLLKYTQIHSSN